MAYINESMAAYYEEVRLGLIRVDESEEESECENDFFVHPGMEDESQ